MGFLLIIVIVLQIITGILLALRYIHSNGASFVFALLFIHIGRGLYYGSYYYNPNTSASSTCCYNNNNIILICLGLTFHSCAIFFSPINMTYIYNYRNTQNYNSFHNNKNY